MKPIKFIVPTLTLLVLLAPTVAFAQPQSVEQVIGVIAKWQGWITRIFWIVAAIFIVWAAFKFLTSGGDEKKLGEAKTAFIYALVAIGVALLSGVARDLVADIIKPTT